jgi:hypothetical protein
MARRPPACDTPDEMNRLGCPHLVRETVTYRESLDLSRPAPVLVTVNWYCGHPFHGIRLDLGDAQAVVEERCAACTLPRPDGAETAADQRDGVRAAAVEKHR